jgi:hypothetical protein
VRYWLTVVSAEVVELVDVEVVVGFTVVVAAEVAAVVAAADVAAGSSRNRAWKACTLCGRALVDMASAVLSALLRAGETP